MIIQIIYIYRVVGIQNYKFNKDKMMIIRY